MSSAEQTYLFRHALLCEAAYALHLPSERAGLHLLAIESLQAATQDAETGTITAELARHAKAAQEGVESADRDSLMAMEIGFRRRAAEYALRRDATAEVVEHMLRLADLPQPALKPRMDCLARAGSLLMGLGMLTRAEAIAWRMNKLAREAGDAVQEARSLRALMAVEATIGKSELADIHLGQSLNILEQHGDRGELASTLRAFALHALSRGRYEESQQWIDRALGEAEGDDWERALLHDTQGELQRQQGRFIEALQSYRDSISLSLKLGNTIKARDTRAGAASCLLELGRLDEAEAEARALTEEYRRAGRAADVSSVTMVLAAVESRRGRYSESVALYRKVVQAQTEQGRIWYQIDANSKLAETLCEAGRIAEALPHADECLRLSLEQDSHSGVARAHWLRGWVFHAQARLKEAETELVRAAAMQEKLQEANRLSLILERLRQVREELAGSPQKAS
jgi:tetratricopeptide (TPR) repeat protein